MLQARLASGPFALAPVRVNTVHEFRRDWAARMAIGRFGRLRRAAATLDSGSSMLLAVQKSLADSMKGCKSAMLGKAKAKSDGQSGQNEVPQAFRDPGFCQDVL